MISPPKPKAGHDATPHGSFQLPLDMAPMEVLSADDLPEEGGWQFEPKWDGFRCLAFKAGREVELRAKSGKPLGRYFPEVVAMFAGLPEANFVIDGELVIEMNGRLSFESLQMRLHPAESRIRKLSLATPARFVMFDMLASDGEILMACPLAERRGRLETFAKTIRSNALMLSPCTDDLAVARRWLSGSGQGDIDGVIAKRFDGSYESGERAMIKVKRLRTADCVVGGFRYLEAERQVGSLLLGLYDDKGELDHVGYSSTISDEERPDLTRCLEALRQPHGFTGKSPGAPSRWSTGRSGAWKPLEPSLVVEVRFDHVTGNRFRHGTKLVRWRPDKNPLQCTFEQLAPPLANPDLS